MLILADNTKPSYSQNETETNMKSIFHKATHVIHKTT